jgi:hypothetical protein
MSSMAPSIPAPKFVKRVHHVVPAGWQKRFRGADANGKDEPGPHYKNVLDGKCDGPVGPGRRMSEQYANIVFDDFYRPSDAIEDRLSLVESEAMNALDSVITTSTIRVGRKIDLAFFLALQAVRYPDRYSTRLDLGRLLAIALKDVSLYPDAAALNAHLRVSGLLPGASVTPAEFSGLATSNNLAAELDEILKSHGYEPHYNVGLVLDAALPLAEHLLGLDWQLVKAAKPSFILSDRPMPTQNLGYQFSLGISASLALRFKKADQPPDDSDIPARAPRGQFEINEINNEGSEPRPNVDLRPWSVDSEPLSA